jgi:acetoin:2,6-dichlorophenolindophenol oxidoreductase subunit alpha
MSDLPAMTSSPAAPTILELYGSMARIRSFELLAEERFARGEIPGILHSSAGHEAVAAGVCGALAIVDRLTSTHRGHHHLIARGIDPKALFAELLGRRTGLSGGKGGSMHVADAPLGVLGTNGLVGGGIPHAVGSALKSKLTGDNAVTVAFFGDGAINGGAFAESLNLAAIWSLPVLFVCENNGWGQFSRTDALTAGSAVARARAAEIEAEALDGWDVRTVSEATRRAVADVRSTKRPQLLDAHCYRISGHTIGDQAILGGVEYRDPEEQALARAHDPLDALVMFEPSLAADSRAIAEAASAEMLAAYNEALREPMPDPCDALSLTHEPGVWAS